MGGTRGRVDPNAPKPRKPKHVPGGSKLSRTAVRQLKVAQLRYELRQRKMESSGLRPVLVDRLLSVVE